MKSVQQIVFEISQLNFDQDPRAEVGNGLVLLSELVPALFANGRKPLQHELGATASMTVQLHKALTASKYQECEELFDDLADSMASVGDGIFDYRKYDVHNVTEQFLLRNVDHLYLAYQP